MVNELDYAKFVATRRSVPAEDSNVEKRNFTRVDFTIHARLTIDGGTFDGEVGNISLRGIFIRNIAAIPIGTQADISISLSSIQPDIAINIQAVAVRSTAEGTGFEFCRVDVESFTHLRNIVSYASSDENIMEEFVTYLDHKLHEDEQKDS